MQPPSVMPPLSLALAEPSGGNVEAPLQTIWETDYRGMNHYQSPAWYRYVGDDPGGSFGEDWLRFYHPEDREYLKQEWQKSLASEGAHRYDIEVRIRRHDGEYRWFRVQGMPQKSSDGQVVKWTGTCTDIHDRKMSGAALAAPADCTAGERALAKRVRRFFHPGLIERRLFLIVLAGLLPLVLLSFGTLLDAAHRHKRQLLDTVSGSTQTILTAIDTELKVSISAVEALAASPRLAQKDFAGFREEAREMLEWHPGWANIVLSDTAGQQLLNLKVPPGQALPRRVDFNTVEQVVRSGKPVVGNVVYSPVLKTFAFGVIVPVKRGNEVPYVLSAVVLPDAIQDILRQQRFPDQGLATISDRNDNVVARSLHHEKWIGGRISEGLLRALREGHSDTPPLTRTLEGVSVYTVFHRSPLTGWHAAIGVPAAAVDAPIYRSYGLLAAAIAASALAGLLVALFIGRTLTRPLRELEGAALAMGQGQSPAVPESEFPEVRQIASALSSAHIEREKLLQRERESRLLEQEARQIAEQASKAKDEFLAMLGHELRNPLAAISMASQILDHAETSGPHAAAANDAKAILRRQVRNLTQLTDDLLDASRVIMGKITLDRKPVDVAAVVHSALDTLEKTTRLSDYMLTLSLEPAWIDADATRIDQVVVNLLTNAVKYTPPPGRIWISLRQEGGEAVLRVRDSGLGIEPDLLPRMFELFVQGQRSASRSQGGLGIGLTLVRRLVELHGGRVEARSEGPGKGSEFIVRLPAIAAPDRPATASLANSPDQRRTIVIVEDNDDVRTGLRRFLELKGHCVHEASEGKAGLEMILGIRPDFVLADIGLPGMDGLDIARAVRERAGQTGHLPRLIAITGYGSPNDIARGLLAGFDHYLVKPVDMSALDELVSQTPAPH